MLKILNIFFFLKSKLRHRLTTLLKLWAKGVWNQKKSKYMNRKYVKQEI